MTPPNPPSPSESPNPDDVAAGSSTASGPTSSTDGLAFVADAGPAFDADGAADQPPPAPVESVLDVAWEEETVRGLLAAQGEVMHVAVAVDKESAEWRYTEGDLSSIAPPLTRILNRYDATRAAAQTGDELALIIGLTGYAGRSIAERRVAIARARADEAPAPITGMSPEGVTTHPAESENTWQVDG